MSKNEPDKLFGCKNHGKVVFVPSELRQHIGCDLIDQFELTWQGKIIVWLKKLLKKL